MKAWNYLWIIVLIGVVGFGSIVSCGDDDDDDNENPSSDDDDDLGAGTETCVQITMACFDLPEATAAELCTSYYEFEEQCNAAGATETFLACVGNDCSAWDACAVAWEDAINC